MPYVHPMSIKFKDNEYMESGKWKCSKSPSGAHHWIVVRKEMKCKYCDEVRQAYDNSNQGLFHGGYQGKPKSPSQ